MAEYKDPFLNPVTSLDKRDWVNQLPQSRKADSLVSDLVKIEQSGTEALQRAMRNAQKRKGNALGDELDRLYTTRRIIEERGKLSNIREQQAAMAKAQEALASIKSFDQYTKEIQSYAGLPYSEQDKLYEDYIKQVADIRAKIAGPDVLRLDVERQVRDANPAPAEPERGWFRAIGDFGLGLTAGVASIPKIAIDAGEALFGDGKNEWSESVGGAVEWLQDKQSVVEKDARKERMFDLAKIAGDKNAGALEKLFRSAGATLGNMSAGSFANLIGNVVPTMVLTGGVGAGAKALQLARGASKVVAGRAASRAALTTGVVLNAGLTAGDAANTAMQNILAMDESQLKKLDEWKDILAKHGGDKQAAQLDVANQAARVAALASIPLATATTLIPGSLDQTIASSFTNTSRGIIKSGLAGAALGSAEEGIPTVLANLASQEFGSDVGALDNAGPDFMLGLIGEGVPAVGWATFNSWIKSPDKLKQAKTVEEILQDLGESPDAAAVMTEEGTVNLGKVEIAGAVLVEGADGVWRYKGEGEPRSDTANKFLKQQNGIEVEDIQPGNLKSKRAFDDVMTMPKQDLLDMPGVAAAVKDVQKKHKLRKAQAILLIRKWVARKRGLAALDTPVDELALPPTGPVDKAQADRIIRIYSGMSDDKLAVSQLMQPYLQAADGDVTKAKEAFIAEVKARADATGQINLPFNAPAQPSTAAEQPGQQEPAVVRQPGETPTQADIRPEPEPSAPSAPTTGEQELPLTGGRNPTEEPTFEAISNSLLPEGLPRVTLTRGDAPISFDSDFDRAAYIVAIGKDTKAGQYLKWLESASGWNLAQLEAYADSVLEAVNSTNDTQIPNQLSVPTPVPVRPAPAEPFQPTDGPQAEMEFPPTQPDLPFATPEVLETIKAGTLPQYLKVLRPRPIRGNENIQFELPFDLAAYMATGDRGVGFRNWLKETSGWNDTQLDAYIARVSDAVQITNGDSIPSQAGTIPAPSQPGASGIESAELPAWAPTRRFKKAGQRLEFANDFDTAAYIVAKGLTDSTLYHGWMKSVAGWNDQQVAEYADQVLRAVETSETAQIPSQLASAAPAVPRPVPVQEGLPFPTQQEVIPLGPPLPLAQPEPALPQAEPQPEVVIPFANTDELTEEQIANAKLPAGIRLPNIGPEFELDFDKAAFILTKALPRTTRARLIRWMEDSSGWSADKIKAYSDFMPTGVAEAEGSPIPSQLGHLKVVSTSTKPMPTEVEVSENAKAVITQAVGVLRDSTAPGSDKLQAVLRISQVLRNDLTPETRAAIRRGAAAGLPTEVISVIRASGLEALVSDDSTQQWAKIIEGAKGSGTVEAALKAMADAPGDVGQSNSDMAKELIGIFKSAGIPFPKLKYSPKKSDILGEYETGPHEVTVRGNGTAVTLLHETQHALTMRGVADTFKDAKNGNQDAADLLALMEVMRQHVAKNIGTALYGGTLQVESLAELINPEFLTLIDTLDMPDLEVDVPLKKMEVFIGSTKRVPKKSKVVGNAARAWAKLNKPSSMFDTLLEVIKTLIDRIVPGGVREGSLREGLMKASAEFTRITGKNFSTPTSKLATKNSLHDITVFSVTGDTINAAGGPIQGKDSGLTSPRETFDEVMANIQAGVGATPVSIGRGVWQSAQSRDGKAFKTSMSRFLSRANELLHDAMTPVIDLMNKIETMGLAPPRLVHHVVATMRLAPGRRDQAVGDISDYATNDLRDAIGKMARKYKATTETIIRDFGYYLTAKYAPQANQYIIDRMIDHLAELQQLDSTPELRAEIKAVTAEIDKRKDAVRNPNDVKTHAVKLAGNMSDVQAANMRRAVEKNYGVEDLEALAQSVYKLNSYRLALDIETGKTPPEVAVKFLNRPEILGKLKELRRLGELNESSEELALPQNIKDVREEVAKLVVSDYVPMTGNPKIGLDAALLQGESAAPNVKRDYRMEGRDSIPDNGIEASLASVIKSANFAGWRRFQRAFHKLYTGMSAEQAEEAGIARKTLSSAKDASGGIVYRDGNHAYVYELRDKQVLDAIRKANVDDVNHIIEFLATPTRMFAYMATQLSPWFAPKNWFRDLWERSENIRRMTILTEEGQEVDMNAVGKRMWRYGTNPAMFKAAARFASGRPSKGTREDEAIRSLASHGALYVTSDLFSRDRRNLVREVSKQSGLSSKVKRSILKWVETYNHTFDFVPVMSAYMSAIDYGATSEQAAAVALETMNFRKAGAAMGLPRMLFAFAQPSVTGGVNAFANLYDRKTGRVRIQGLARLTSYVVGFLMLQSFARMISDDDEGGDIIDQLSDYTKYNTIPIGLGEDGGILTIPLSFGIPRIANGIARSVLGIGTGEKTISEGVEDTIVEALIPSVSPLTPSNVDWQKNPVAALLLTFSPTLAKPLAELTANVNYFGSPIIKLKWEDTEQFRTEQYGYNIPDWWRTVAREFRKMTGVDMAPDQVRHLVLGYMVGAPRLVIQVAEKDSAPAALSRWIYRQPYDKAWKSQFYDAQDQVDMLAKRRNANALNNPTEEERKLLSIWSDWEQVESELKSRRGKVTRNNSLSEKAKAKLYEKIQLTKDAYQADVVRKIRQARGLSSG